MTFFFDALVWHVERHLEQPGIGFPRLLDDQSIVFTQPLGEGFFRKSYISFDQADAGDVSAQKTLHPLGLALHKSSAGGDARRGIDQIRRAQIDEHRPVPLQERQSIAVGEGRSGAKTNTCRAINKKCNRMVSSIRRNSLLPPLPDRTAQTGWSPDRVSAVFRLHQRAPRRCRQRARRSVPESELRRRWRPGPSD